MKNTSESYIDEKGILTSVESGESEDGSFGFAFFMTPNDIDKVDMFTNWLRLHYSELNGVPCVDPTDPYGSGQTGVEWLLEIEKENCDFVYRQLAEHPKQFDIPGYRPVLDVLVAAMRAVHSNALPKQELINQVTQAIYLGCDYLQKRGVKIYQEINGDYIHRQPIDPPH